jgi:hypothetical protein
MADDQKDKGDEPTSSQSVPTPESNRSEPPPRHPLFGALKGYVQVAPGTDLTEPADPTWGMVYPKM